MADIFISYARSTKATAQCVADALRADGHSVWWDDELPVHRAYADVIEERLRAAKAVVVLWSADAAKSQWVRAEADLARNAGTLVQLTVEGCALPLPFNQIQCVDLCGWAGDCAHPSWAKVVTSVAALSGRPPAAPVAVGPARAAAAARENLLAVLAFDNLSNDADLSYFSDGVSEEILYTVARAKGLRVIGKASSFQFRGRDKTGTKIAEVLGATHVLDGSVRRAGNNIRISAELVDTATLETLWSDRYDRALTDIFALQDEIAAAIAKALDHHFAPQRTPMSVDPVAYDLYLQARAIYVQDMTWADQAKCVTLLEGAVSRAPDFAQAWGRLGVYRKGESAAAAARRGLELDPNCAISMAALAVSLPAFADHGEKLRLTERAYALSPDDHLVAGVYQLVATSLGLLTRSCTIADERVARDPLSPMEATARFFAYRTVRRNDAARAIADTASRDFPDSDYVRFHRAIIAIYDGDMDLATAISGTLGAGSNATVLQVLVIFIRTVAAMDAPTRAIAVDQFLLRGAPATSLVDVGLAASVGESDRAMAHLLDAVCAGRPIKFATENDGRAPVGATTAAALFLPNTEILRRDPRYAEVCVRLGLYDFWRDSGRWPDVVAELAPFYDLKAECARVAPFVPPYRAQPVGPDADATPPRA